MEENPLSSLNEEEIAHIFEKIEPFLPINDYEVPLPNNFGHSESQEFNFNPVKMDSPHSDVILLTNSQTQVSIIHIKNHFNSDISYFSISILQTPMWLYRTLCTVAQVQKCWQWSNRHLILKVRVI